MTFFNLQFYLNLGFCYFIFYFYSSLLYKYKNKQNAPAAYLRPSFLVPDETFVFQMNVKHVSVWQDKHQSSTIRSIHN